MRETFYTEPRHQEVMGKKLAVMEIFSSIQGEGAFIGMPCTFVRLQGCNLDCPFCDTKKSWATLEPNMTIEEIVTKCDQDLVIITGGEPCMQAGETFDALVELLHYNNIMVAMETNGTLPIPEKLDWVTCSPKQASDTLLGTKKYHIHEDNFDKIGEYKFVVTPEFQWSDIPVELNALPKGSIWLQPEGSQMEEMWKKAYKIAMEEGGRVGIQLHKVVGVE